jgi:toxin ParE1/3/4
MAARQRRVVWTDHAQRMLDEALAYIDRDSHAAAERLLIEALDAASSLDVFSERGRLVPELNQPNVRELFVQSYRLLYEGRSRIEG